MAREPERTTGYVTNIERDTLSNEDYRRVLYTARNTQLVLMTLAPGDEIGREVHAEHDQFIRVEAGTGTVLLGGEEYPLSDGVVVIIPAGVEHNVVNTSADAALRLYTLYSPPEHPDGTVHRTKRDAHPTGSGLPPWKGFPQDAVIGAFGDADQVSGAVDVLKAAGFPEDKILVLAGERGVERIDPTGKGHGWRGRLIRASQVLGDEREQTDRHVQELRAGHFLVGVWGVVDEEKKTRARDALAAHGGHFINYYSRWTTHELVP
jgi:mannose-6-phosphate isomerase-like protein (cupin superfamily)